MEEQSLAADKSKAKPKTGAKATMRATQKNALSNVSETPAVIDGEDDGFDQGHPQPLKKQVPPIKRPLRVTRTMSCGPSTSPAHLQLNEVFRPRTRSTAASISTVRETIMRTKKRTIYTAGKPPWYNVQGEIADTFVIGICGGSASGKTSVAQKIVEALDVPWVTMLSMDSFYKVLNDEQHRQVALNKYDFDHPDAFDFELLVDTLKRLKEGKKVNVPIYNFISHRREDKTVRMYGANVVLFEGILSFVRQDILELLDLKVFVDTDSDIRLARRLKRDIQHRGLDIRGVIAQYKTFVKPAFEAYIAPSMVHADIIVPKGAENEVAIDLIVQHVQKKMNERGCFSLREKLATVTYDESRTAPSSLRILPRTRQVLGLITYIRNKDTLREELMFYSQRLMRLLMEYTISLFPFEDVKIQTADGLEYEGKQSSAKRVCGVPIMRAGETMESSLSEVCKDVEIGKILIQTSEDHGEPELFYLTLPKDISEYKVILMDAQVATGAAAMMAIRVLLDHEVPEENISLVSLLMAVPGVYAIGYAFPSVKMITSAVDAEVNEKFHVQPGMGNFGDRYFGTD